MFKFLSAIFAIAIAIAIFGFLTGYFISAEEASEDTNAETINSNIYQ